MTEFSTDIEFAREQDSNKEFEALRNQFLLPEDLIYLCGNSLGLQPKNALSIMDQELKKWSELGVEGHFTSDRPWVSYHQNLNTGLARLLNVSHQEVVAMNSLTVNLHLMLASFYQPKGKQTKIIIESTVFPSDRYAVTSVVKKAGFDEDHVIELSPEHENALDVTDLQKTIKEHEGEIALVLLSGVNYLTGQAYDLEGFGKLCQSSQITFGLDLAHAIANTHLNLSEGYADFAVWCSYKYLNGGPGGVGGAYVNKRHLNNPHIPRLHGWWSNQQSSRFEMNKTIDAYDTAEAWQLSNPSIFQMAPLIASLQIFESISEKTRFDRSQNMTSYLRYLLIEAQLEGLTILTPQQHGAQLSLVFKNETIATDLRDKGIVVDQRNWKSGTLIRVAPTAMYNTYSEIVEFVEILKKLCKK